MKRVLLPYILTRALLLLTVTLLWCSSAQAAITTIASVQCNQITANGLSTFTCNVPAGTVNNDLLVFSIGYQNGTPATPTGPGFTLIAYDSPANGFVGAVSMGKCASSEGASETITTGTGVNWGSGQLTAYRGTICPTFPVDHATGGSSHGFGTTVTLPALGGVTSVANEWAIQVATVAPSTTVTTYTPPAGSTVDGTIVSSGTGQQAGLGVTHIVYASSGSTVTAQTGTLSAANSWAGLQFSLIPSGCPTLTTPCDFLHECGATTVSTLLNCFVVPAGINETASVYDANAVCSPGTAPVGGGGNFCPVGWNGTAWLEN